MLHMCAVCVLDMDLSADPAPPPPPTMPLHAAHDQPNGDHDVSGDVAAKLAASSQPAALLAEALRALPEVSLSDE